MTSNVPANTVVATYRVKAGCEAAFHALLKNHYPTLRKLDLVTDEPPVIYQGSEGDDGADPIVFEIFTWKDAAAVQTAHHAPEVMAIWRPMGELVENRASGPMFAFPHVTRLDLGDK
ncbi:MAG: hypothetical protein H6834_12320 [Planctomycetes bacterium]|nr:hypothetical protein [Planctomycetota bacterium]